MADDQKRFQVFVSSTYLNLKEERQAVTAALLECDAFPAGMELFPAADDDAWTLIQRVISESDYYLLVIGGKYGSVDPSDDLGYTEKEYDYAISIGKPVMAFLHGDPGKIPAELSERTEEMQQRLQAFRSKVEGSKHVKYWTTAEGLAGQVALSFNRFVRQYPAVGWIRADQASSTESLRALTEAQRTIADLRAQLETVRTEPPAGSAELAQGADEHVLPLHADVRYNQEGTAPSTVQRWLFLETSWDEIFTAIAPRLLQEASESELRSELERWLLIERNLILRAYAKDSFEEEGVETETESLRVTKVRVDNGDFGTIIVQLVALGLIHRSERRRSVKDKDPYWTLTPFGATRTIQLRAIRRPPATT